MVTDLEMEETKLMFTGIVETIGFVLDLDEEGDGYRLSIRCPGVSGASEEGASVAVNGVCLTVESASDDALVFHVSSETHRTTNLGDLNIGAGVNVETSLKAGDEMGGHFVTGHVEGTGEVREIEAGEGEKNVEITTDVSTTDLLVPRGCVAVDGVSLTPVDVGEGSFSVVLIPETLERTTLGELSEKQTVNIEVDLLARYVQKQVGDMETGSVEHP